MNFKSAETLLELLTQYIVLVIQLLLKVAFFPVGLRIIHTKYTCKSTQFPRYNKFTNILTAHFGRLPLTTYFRPAIRVKILAPSSCCLGRGDYFSQFRIIMKLTAPFLHTA
jgi:hypothetical protein